MMALSPSPKNAGSRFFSARPGGWPDWWQPVRPQIATDLALPEDHIGQRPIVGPVRTSCKAGAWARWQAPICSDSARPGESAVIRAGQQNIKWRYV